jgi:hypothetical protein
LPAGEYAYLLGLYLGDGCLSAARRDVYKLRITLDSRYPGIIRECASAMAGVLPNAVAVQRRAGCSEVYSHSKRWICLFPQHGPGRKHEREIVLAEGQRQIAEGQPRRLLRGLIHSDGCRFTNPVRHQGKLYRYSRYQFTNRSADIRRIFCEACDRLGIEWRQMNPRNISVARRASVARLDEFVGPKA